MSDRLTGEVVQMRSDVLYLVRLVEKLEKRILQLEETVKQQTNNQDPLLGKIIEKL